MKQLHYQLKDQSDVVIFFEPKTENKFYVIWDGINLGYIWFKGVDQQANLLLWGASTDLLQVYLPELVHCIQSS